MSAAPENSPQSPEIRSYFAGALKRWWVRWNVNRHHSGDQHALDRLHVVEDPWNLDHTSEEFRFRETNNLIQEHLGSSFSSLLEIGCAEGRQTEHLSKLSDTVLGIDISERAIRRAQQRGIGNARFRVGNVSDLDGAPSGPEYDLVTACEVLYYCDAPSAMISEMNRLGRTCVVSYFAGRGKTLDPLFADKKDVHRESILCDGKQWNIVWWRNDAVTG